MSKNVWEWNSFWQLEAQSDVQNYLIIEHVTEVEIYKDRHSNFVNQIWVVWGRLHQL